MVKPESNTMVHELRRIIPDHRVQMIGPIRQEILSGIRSESQFKKLQKHLESFPDLPAITKDYVTAANYFNRCRSKGIQGSNTDFLICAIANRTSFQYLLQTKILIYPRSILQLFSTKQHNSNKTVQRTSLALGR
jgi:hypothetical protein